MRALAIVHDEAEMYREIARIFERALISRIADGETIEVDVTGILPEGGKMLIRRHDDHLHLDNADAEEEGVSATVTATPEEVDAYKTRAAVLQEQIVTTSYYVAGYEAALAEYGVTKDAIAAKQVDTGVLSEVLNTFWFALPDSADIRRGPFFELCDLCEGLPQ